MTPQQLLEAYFEACRRPLSVQTVTRQFWPRFVEFCEAQEISRVAALRAKHIAAFQQKLLWEPGPKGRLYAANTVDGILRQVRHVLTWAHRSGLVAADPCSKLILARVVPAPKRLLTHQQLKAILAAAERPTPQGWRDAALLAVLTETDLSGKQCQLLNLADEATLVLSDESRTLVRIYLEKGRPLMARSDRQPALFLTRYGARIGAQTVGNALEQAVQRAGLEGPVTLRVLGRSYRALHKRGGQSLHSLLTE